jgi:hypothetical protein
MPHRVGVEGLDPTSLSFVSPYVGYLLGYAQQGGSAGRIAPRAVLARTDDGGGSWHRVLAPPVSSGAAVDGAPVRFVTADVGFVFARRLWRTVDAGQHWVRLPRLGRVVDLMAADGKVWILARGCGHCQSFSLDMAKRPGAGFHRVGDAPTFRHDDVTFVKGSGSELYIQTTPHQQRGVVWRSYSGASWSRQLVPCQTGGVLAAWSPAGLAAVCNVTLYGVGEQSKSAYVSFDGAHTWTSEGEPSIFGYIDDLAAGSSRDWVLDEERTGFETTTDGGSFWRFGALSVPLGDGVTGAEFTTPTTVVGLPAYQPDRDFFHSEDGGLTWSVTQFPAWPRH